MSDPFYAGLPDDDEPAQMDGSVDASVDTRREVVPGSQVEPVLIEVVRRCQWKAKPCGVCGKAKTNPVHGAQAIASGKGHKFGRKQGCERCGRAKYAPEHAGAPESFNLFASGSWEAYQSAKQRWHAVLGPLLRESEMPYGLDRVVVEGEVSFGDARERDQGNHRVVIEKALGDVLVELGYLQRDTWGHYEFGNLRREEREGVNALRLTLFCFAPVPAEGAAGAQESLL